MTAWVAIAAEWLEPVCKEMLRRLLAGGCLQAAETLVRCNDPDMKCGGTTEVWLWVFSRPGSDVVFDWLLSRRHDELSSLIHASRASCSPTDSAHIRLTPKSIQACGGWVLGARPTEVPRS
jgi:hypothetical protein